MLGINICDELKQKHEKNLHSMNDITQKIFELQEERDKITKEINKKIKELEKNYNSLLSFNMEIENQINQQNSY